MKIVVDQKIPYIDSAFGGIATLVKLDSGSINNSTVQNADALVVRSETKVNEGLLTGSKVSFVGTATIGIDHIDSEFLFTHGIKFASAPGCNANAVVQYVFSILFTIAEKKKFLLKDKTLGVVGSGNVGSKVARIARAIGMDVMENDPPLQRSIGDSKFVSLDDVMGADIVTLHVPLTSQGSDPTFHLFDGKQIARMKPGSILINSSRGAVVKGEALTNALSSGKLSAAALDVWEHEPNIDLELLRLCAIGTPHIAGYSIDGKVNATRMIYQAFCQHFNLSPEWDSSTIIPQPKNPIIEVHENASDEETLSKVIKCCYDAEKDDKNLRNILSLLPDQRAKFFKQLRGNYNFRHEFSNYKVVLARKMMQIGNALKAFGFTVHYN